MLKRPRRLCIVVVIVLLRMLKSNVEICQQTIPRPMYIEDLEDREFSGEDREFSSFAYRIAAARTLGRFMRMPPMFGPEDENISKVEAMLTNWRMHLPPAKRDALDKSLTLDEMMFRRT